MSDTAVADIGLIGLAVMGQNLVLNMNDHGFVVCAYNRTVSKVDHFLENEAKGTKIVGAHSVEELCPSTQDYPIGEGGNPVDQFIGQLLPYLEKGDIIVDGGNSHFPDSIRRTKELEEKGILFVGCGVSGGEEGARYGPSMMPGGSTEAWPHLKPIFQAIAAKADGEPCCDWVGETGAGHYVKMVHNGIEYGDMQLICEAYQLLRDALGLTNDEIADVFEEWNGGELNSFLIEITRDIMRYKDSDGQPLVEKIRDTAGQKGTGKWTAISSLDLGVPVTLIGEAVFSRCLSALKDERVRASEVLSGPSSNKYQGEDKKKFIHSIGKALYASKIISYAQGFMLMREAARNEGWHLNYGGIALMWKGGCIIRSAFLGDIKAAYLKNPDLESLLFDDFFRSALDKAQEHWRIVVSQAALLGIPTPAFSTAWPSTMATRDYFGAHTYELLSKPGDFVHTNWTGRGGNVSSTSYNA
ncbi:6-phosphogluconate dehydrogenase [Syncephalis plumigaleata]|nr:6-phosphogluconate dehydrogenase [Syncephalis plumigaleata]